jgi:hypothetical protein
MRSSLLSIAIVIFLSPVLFAADSATPIDASKAKRDDAAKIDWYDARAIGLEGQGFTDVKAPYDRLPSRAEGKVRDAVWNLSRNSAGLCVRFRTGSPAIHCRWTNTSAKLAMPHMPATGVSGVDLYVKDEMGTWRWRRSLCEG